MREGERIKKWKHFEKPMKFAILISRKRILPELEIDHTEYLVAELPKRTRLWIIWQERSNDCAENSGKFYGFQRRDGKAY